MISVEVTIARQGLTWAVLVGDKVVASGLTRPEAVAEKWRQWWAQPEQRAAARERICGG